MLFNCFRACCAFFGLGLIVAMYAAVLPLFLSDTSEAAPRPNSTWTLWSEQDSEAARGILIISTTQACLMLVGCLCFRWRSARGAEAAESRAAALRRDALRRMRSREKRRVQLEVEQQMAEESRGLRRRGPSPAA